MCCAHFRAESFKARNLIEKYMDEALKRSPRSIQRVMRLRPEAVTTKYVPAKTKNPMIMQNQVQLLRQIQEVSSMGMSTDLEQKITYEIMYL